MKVGLLTYRINNKLEKSNLINEHPQNRELVPLTVSLLAINQLETFSSSEFKISCDEISI